MNTLYKVVKIEGKDLGCVAIKDIKKGEFYQVQWFSLENQQSPVYVANWHFSRCPDRC